MILFGGKVYERPESCEKNIFWTDSSLPYPLTEPLATTINYLLNSYIHIEFAFTDSKSVTGN